MTAGEDGGGRMTRYDVISGRSVGRFPAGEVRIGPKSVQTPDGKLCQWGSRRKVPSAKTQVENEEL